MQIDGKSFFLIAAALAAGGAGGYVATEKHMLPPLGSLGKADPPPSTAVAAPPPVVSSVAPSATPPPAPTAPPPPACDDSVGVPGDCPPPGYPTIEGGCGSFATVRCGDMKQGLKPRVAKEAVACLARLTPQERCSAPRVNLCGHAALMNACPEPEALGDGGASAAPSPVTALCRELVASCATASAAAELSLADCQRTLSGMSALGRERTATCLRKHCFDKGLLYCEAAAKPDGI